MIKLKLTNENKKSTSKHNILLKCSILKIKVRAVETLDTTLSL